MSTPRLTAAALLGMFLLPAPAPAQEPATLEFQFPALADRRGAIMLALYDSEAAYEKGDEKGGLAIRGIRLPLGAEPATPVIRLEGLAPGRYAAKMFHDLDGDGVLKFNSFGVPLEPYAFSNNAAATMGPAKWRAAAFTVAAPLTRQTIDLK